MAAWYPDSKQNDQKMMEKQPKSQNKQQQKKSQERTLQSAADSAEQSAEQSEEQPAEQTGFNYQSMFIMLIAYMAILSFSKSGKPKNSTVTGNTSPQKVHANMWDDGEKFNLDVYIHTDSKFDMTKMTAMELDNCHIWHQPDLVYNLESTNDRSDNITLSNNFLSYLKKNGSLWAHTFFTRIDRNHGSKKKFVLSRATQLNTFKEPPKVHARKRLLSGEYTDDRINSLEDIEKAKSETILWVNNWKPILHMRLVHDFMTFPAGGIPATIVHAYTIDPVTAMYEPVIYPDYFWLLKSQYIQVNETVKELNLQISYSAISMMKFQFQQSIESSWKNQEKSGALTTDTDELRRMMLETNPILLGITVAVSVLHIVFDCLAFKNDIQFWRKNKSMKGLSSRTIIMNTVCQMIILLYLLDNDTSWMILFSNVTGIFIEIWKIRKAVDVKFDYTKFPFISFAQKSKTEGEEETAKYDRQAMVYLSYALYPLLIGYAIYSLLYQDHKSWYSWIVGSLVGAVYTFGFIMMCPQLYLNYKLKSVAHLPWRMLTYKALNTFVDDLFAFIITMPTLHRLSCFRDDIVFLIFLYQKWIYRIDYTRANEYGLISKELSEKQELEESKKKI